MDHDLLNRWIHKYLDEGEVGLDHKYNHKGNAYAALTTSKHLTEVERMKLMIRCYKRYEYEIVDQLAKDSRISFPCELMDVNRSGYYKWKKGKGIGMSQIELY